MNKKALRPYLTMQFPATDETFFAGVYKLPAAHCFTFDIAAARMDVRRYWDADFSDDDSKTFDGYVEECDEVVHESVAAHRIADVKVGSFLSGGVDSSYIAACLMPDKTFSVGFDYKDFNETNYAKELSDKLGIENYRKMVTADEFFEVLPQIQYHMDEPQSNLSSVPLWFLAQLAAEQVTVVLSGEGADELFAGYDYYEDVPSLARFKRVVPRGVRRAWGFLVAGSSVLQGRNFLLKAAEDAREVVHAARRVFVYRPESRTRFVRPEYAGGPDAFELCAPSTSASQDFCELSKRQYLDMNMWLPGDILLKADKMCMAHSLELRVPFLDKKVMEFAEHIPGTFPREREREQAGGAPRRQSRSARRMGNAPQEGLPGPAQVLAARAEILRLRKGVLHRPVGRGVLRHVQAHADARRPF